MKGTFYCGCGLTDGRNIVRIDVGQGSLLSCRVCRRGAAKLSPLMPEDYQVKVCQMIPAPLGFVCLRRQVAVRATQVLCFGWRIICSFCYGPVWPLGLSAKMLVLRLQEFSQPQEVRCSLCGAIQHSPPWPCDCGGTFHPFSMLFEEGEIPEEEGG